MGSLCSCVKLLLDFAVFGGFGNAALTGSIREIAVRAVMGRDVVIVVARRGVDARSVVVGRSAVIVCSANGKTDGLLGRERVCCSTLSSSVALAPPFMLLAFVASLPLLGMGFAGSLCEFPSLEEVLSVPLPAVGFSGSLLVFDSSTGVSVVPLPAVGLSRTSGVSRSSRPVVVVPPAALEFCCGGSSTVATTSGGP